MSLFRRIGLPNGLRVINLAKVSVVEFHREQKQIDYIMDSVRNSTTGSFMLFHGGTNKTYSAVYPTVEEAQKEFDDIIKSRNN